MKAIRFLARAIKWRSVALARWAFDHEKNDERN